MSNTNGRNLDRILREAVRKQEPRAGEKICTLTSFRAPKFQVNVKEPLSLEHMNSR